MCLKIRHSHIIVSTPVQINYYFQISTVLATVLRIPYLILWCDVRTVRNTLRKLPIFKLIPQL